MLKSQTLELTLPDGDQEITVRIPRMDCIAAERFLLKAVTMFARAGFRLPKRKTLDASGIAEAAAEAIGGSPEGLLIHLKDLNFEEADELRRMMLEGCVICITDDKSHKTITLLMTDQNIRANILNVSTLFNIRLAVLQHNFGFLLKEKTSDSDVPPLPSNLPNTRIAPRLSPS